MRLHTRQMPMMYIALFLMGLPIVVVANSNPSAMDIPQATAANQLVEQKVPEDWQRASHYFGQAQYIPALARIEKHLMNHPGDGNALFLKVQILIELGECEQAASVAKQLLSFAPLLYAGWIPLLQEVAEQAEPPIERIEPFYTATLLPWEA